MVVPVSIHRRKDLRHAHALAEHVRRQKGLPASLVIPDWIIEKLADQLQAFREERQVWMAHCKAEFEAEGGAVRAEFKLAKERIEAALAATETFIDARRKLDAALAALRGQDDA
jgi:hypothetical protein